MFLPHASLGKEGRRKSKQFDGGGNGTGVGRTFLRLPLVSFAPSFPPSFRHHRSRSLSQRIGLDSLRIWLLKSPLSPEQSFFLPAFSDRLSPSFVATEIRSPGAARSLAVPCSYYSMASPL